MEKVKVRIQGDDLNKLRDCANFVQGQEHVKIETRVKPDERNFVSCKSHILCRVIYLRCIRFLTKVRFAPHDDAKRIICRLTRMITIEFCSHFVTLQLHEENIFVRPPRGNRLMVLYKKLMVLVVQMNSYLVFKCTLAPFLSKNSIISKLPLSTAS